MKFIQLHMLTFFGPSNLNRDDLGRPKVAIIGGVERLRISSQSLKRAWRTSTVFRNYINSEIGVRTKNIGAIIREHLNSNGFASKEALCQGVVTSILAACGASASQDADEEKSKQLVHFSGDEIERIKQVALDMANGSGEFSSLKNTNLSAPEYFIRISEAKTGEKENREETNKINKKLKQLMKYREPNSKRPADFNKEANEQEISSLEESLKTLNQKSEAGGDNDSENKKKKKTDKADKTMSDIYSKIVDYVFGQSESLSPDIAMFGRMFAAMSHYNSEAAVQVSHSTTVGEGVVEDDFFTAVDDAPNTELEDDGTNKNQGGAHLGVTNFGSGLFYTYICIDKDLLIKNLMRGNNNFDDAKALADKTISGLILAATTVSPTGKQASFASRAKASALMVEVGDSQPSSLAVAFADPIYEENGENMLSMSIERLTRYHKQFARLYGDSENTILMNVEDENSKTLQDVLKFVEESA